MRQRRLLRYQRDAMSSVPVRNMMRTRFGGARILIIIIVFTASVSTLIACSWDYPVWSKSKDSDTPLFRFVTKGAAGYIDRTGAIIIPAQFKVLGNHGADFFDGLANVMIRDGTSYYIDSGGKRVAPAH